jgi:hypothetical protein
MTPSRQIMEQITALTDHVVGNKSMGEALRRYGLTFNGSEGLVVIDEAKFAEWLNTRIPTPAVEGY